MPVSLRLAAVFYAMLLIALGASAESVADTVGEDLLAAAIDAQHAAGGRVENAELLVIIDYRKPSHQPRFFLIDRTAGTVSSHLVAHGKGSDPDHDGRADRFSNRPGSKMTSLGSFVTGKTYYGRHGLSLKMHGLDPENSNAERRAIVIHGANYVAPGRDILGRSWGCPALEQQIAQSVIPKIKNGVLIYAVGPHQDP